MLAETLWANQDQRIAPLSSNIQFCFDRTKQGSRFRCQPHRALLGHLGFNTSKTDGRNDGFTMGARVHSMKFHHLPYIYYISYTSMNLYVQHTHSSKALKTGIEISRFRDHWNRLQPIELWGKHFWMGVADAELYVHGSRNIQKNLRCILKNCAPRQRVG